MSQDIEYIKKELKKCEEVDSPFDIKRGDKVKYITLKNGSEFFYDGGIYLKMLDNKVSLKEENSTKTVPISIIDKSGEILYQTRFFIECGEKCYNKNKEEYEKIIKTQQRIIETLIKKNKELEKMLS